MSKYYFLRVKEIEKETEDASTIHFWHPMNEMVTYRPGQFITLLLPDGDNKLRRSYSMSSSPYTDASLAITVKRIPAGFASNLLLDQLKVGDIIEVVQPLGNFFPQQKDDQVRQVVFIGAGSGITPLFSILKSVLMVEPESDVFLVYGCRDEKSTIFREKIDALQQKYKNRFHVVYSLSMPSSDWKGEVGRLNKTRLLKILGDFEDLKAKEAEYFLCGPEGLMEESQRALAIMGIPVNQIRKESFASPILTDEVETVDDDSLQARTIKLIYEGTTHELEVKPHETVLEAAMNMDIDLPYSCQAGRCTACMGRCTSGKIAMDEEDVLTEAELAEGFILTCVSHPMSDDVVIEVD